MTRRGWLVGVGAGVLLGKAVPARLAICNETFQGASFAEGCRLARRTGYSGVEVDPSTLGADPAAIPLARRREMRDVMVSENVEFAGLHSFLKAPAGLHITTPDNAVRQRSWEYVRRLIDLCADLGDDAVMVLGSARQRAAANAAGAGEATRRLEEGLASVSAQARTRRVTILLEPLAPHLCNVVTTLGEAVSIVKRLDTPAVLTMLDTHNTAGETEPVDKLIRRHYPLIRHVHLNEMDGRRPGADGYDFAPVFRTLRELGYRRWLSVEVFDFKPDGETVAREAAAHLRRVEAGGSG